MSRRKNRVKTGSVVQLPSVQAKFDVAQTTSQNRKHWANADGLSARASVSAAVRRVVRLRSRYEAENNGWYSGIIQTAANHIAGNGARLQILTANLEGNTRLEKFWRTWAARIDLADIVRMAVSTYWRDGEAFLMRASLPRNYRFALDLRMIEADQVASPMLGSLLNDPFVDDGIRFDRSTNELSFYIYDNHPGSNTPSSTMDGEWYDANQVLHLFRAERPGQTRGIPRATPALQMLPIMRRQEMATLYTSETAANFGMYMKTNTGAMAPAANASGAFAEMELATNMLTILPEGWDVGQVESKQPGSNYEGFQRQCLMSFSRCTQMPYGLAAGTSKDSNFSSFKGDIKQIWEPEVRTEQNRVENAIYERVWQWFLEDAMYVPGLLDGMPLTGDIDHNWHHPPLPELDAVDSANAASIRISTGQSSLTEEHARRGQDWSVVSKTAADDFGVSPEQYKAAVFAKTFGLVPGAPMPSTPVSAPVASASPQGEYTSLGQRAFTNNQKRIKNTLDQLASGEMGQVMAEQTLASIGLSEDRITALIADALDGGVEDSAVSEVEV